MQKVKTTCAIITNSKNEILLIKRGRDPFRGYWALVSGVGESRQGKAPDDAVKGEIFWDLGTDTFQGKRIFTYPVTNDQMTDEVIVFLGTIDESRIKLKPGFSEEYKWVSVSQDQMPKDLAFEHSDIIKKYLAQLAS